MCAKRANDCLAKGTLRLRSGQAARTARSGPSAAKEGGLRRQFKTSLLNTAGFYSAKEFFCGQAGAGGAGAIFSIFQENLLHDYVGGVSGFESALYQIVSAGHEILLFDQLCAQAVVLALVRLKF